MLRYTICLSVSIILLSCSKNTYEKHNGVDLTKPVVTQDKQQPAKFITKPGRVQKTYHNDYRIIPIFKIDLNDKGQEKYSSSAYKHTSWHEDDSLNAWHNNFIPGIAALHGYNITNVADFNVANNKRTNLFKKNVFINTIYYPTPTYDTLQGQPIQRNYYLISVYNEDTNNDSLINHKDLRRFYHFDMKSKKRTALIPLNYSVLSSQYDYRNDIMYVKARLDENNNGIRETIEPIHIFWIDLKNPQPAKRAY